MDPLSWKRSLTKHLVIHDKREFSCGDCGKLCVRNKAFKNHMVSHMTLEIHVILNHYADYFFWANKTLRHTNGEFVEQAHYTIKNEETLHRLKVTRKLGSQGHLEKSLKSISWHNSRRVGILKASKFRIRNSPSLIKYFLLF